MEKVVRAPPAFELAGRRCKPPARFLKACAHVIGRDAASPAAARWRHGRLPAQARSMRRTSPLERADWSRSDRRSQGPLGCGIPCRAPPQPTPSTTPQPTTLATPRLPPAPSSSNPPPPPNLHPRPNHSANAQLPGAFFINKKAHAIRFGTLSPRAPGRKGQIGHYRISRYRAFAVQYLSRG
jgi:hypothetical protein